MSQPAADLGSGGQCIRSREYKKRPSIYTKRPAKEAYIPQPTADLGGGGRYVARATA